MDWRKKENWGCNQHLNPTGDHAWDGETLSPYELLFVKVKEHLLNSMGTQAKTAVKYQEWMAGLVGAADV